MIEVGNPNGVLLLDIWHAYRGGTPYATLPALVPEVVVGVELDNGLGDVVGTDLEDTFDKPTSLRRRNFRLAGVHQRGIGDRLGWPVGIEEMSGDFCCLPVRDALTRARDAALHCFDLAVQRRDADPTPAASGTRVTPCCAGSPPERPTSTGRLGSFRRGSE